MAKLNSGTVITGKSGQGKGWYLGFLVEASDKPRVILDPKGEHEGLADHFLLMDRNKYAQAEAMGMATFFTAVRQKFPSIRIQTLGLTNDQYLRLVDGLCESIHTTGYCLFVGSEYHRAAPNGRVPDWVQILHTDARTKQIDWIVDCQRAALLDTTVISQANRRVTFALDDINDLKRIAPYFHAEEGVRPDEYIKSLQPRNCLHLNCDTGEQVRVNTEQLTRKVAHHG